MWCRALCTRERSWNRYQVSEERVRWGQFSRRKENCKNAETEKEIASETERECIQDCCMASNDLRGKSSTREYKREENGTDRSEGVTIDVRRDEGGQDQQYNYKKEITGVEVSKCDGVAREENWVWSCRKGGRGNGQDMMEKSVDVREKA